MKTYGWFVVVVVLFLSGCFGVSSDAKPWVKRADSMIGRSVTTASEMVVVQWDYQSLLLVPVNRDTRRFRDGQKVVATIPIGSRVNVKKRIFKLPKPGRVDYLVVDVLSSGDSHRDVLLIAGGLFLTDENFEGI